MDKSIAEIAGKLTEAQREAISNARDMLSGHGGYPFLTVDVVQGQSWPEGVCQFLTLKSDRLTETGLAVRKYLNGE